MNRKHIDPAAEAEQSNGQYAVVRNRKADIIAICVCVLIALLVWLVFMNRTESDYVELVIDNPAEGYEYKLSVTQVEIEGRVTDLRRVSEIRVVLPAWSADEYHLNEGDLELPDGVALSKSLNLTVEVAASK